MSVGGAYCHNNQCRYEGKMCKKWKRKIKWLTERSESGGREDRNEIGTSTVGPQG